MEQPEQDDVINIPRRLTRQEIREMLQEQEGEQMRLSCCIGNKAGVTYFAGVLFGFLAVSFSGVMIALDPTYERISIFLPIISAVIGVFMPQPTLSD